MFRSLQIAWRHKRKNKNKNKNILKMKKNILVKLEKVHRMMVVECSTFDKMKMGSSY